MGRYDPPPILPPSPALGKPNKDVSGRSFELRVVLFHSWASPPERIKPNCYTRNCWRCDYQKSQRGLGLAIRSEEHTSELQSRLHLVCRLLLEKKKKQLACIHATHRARPSCR